MAKTRAARNDAAANADTPASSLLRRHHRPSRSGGDARRARIGRSSRNERRSSASSPAVAYRCAGLAGRRLQDDRLEVERDGPVELPRPRRLLLGHAPQQLAGAQVAERQLERQQLVERQSQAVDVAAVIGLALEGLGGEVSQRADDVAGIGQVVAPRQLRQAEVGDPGDLVLVDQQVGRLDVAVQDPLVVGVLEGLGGLDADPRHEPPVVRRRGTRPSRRQPSSSRSSPLPRMYCIA